MSFDDGSSSDVQATSPSDWPSDNSSFDLGIPTIDTPVTVAANTNYGSGDTNAPTNVSVGEPINSATGNVSQVQRDYMALGPFPLRFERFYNSLSPIPAFATTELGVGWRGTYDSAVMLITGQGTPAAVVIRPDGQSLLFTNSGGANQWSPANPTSRASLTSQTDSSGNILGWTYTTGDDFSEAYSAAGQLMSITNRAGLTQSLTYNNAGQLATVTDPFGHSLLFTYNAQGQLAQTTDPAGHTYQYAYDGNNNLISVTYPDSTARQYLYENGAFPNAMTGLVDENGTRFVTWSYDDQGRAISSVLAGGIQPISITYNPDGSSSVTDARGTTRQHTFTRDVAGALRPTGTAVVSCSNSCPTVSSNLTYDFVGLTASGNDPNGNTTALTYDARGMLTSRTEAVGTPLARTVSITSHPVFHLPTQITFPDHVVNYAYDGHGNRISKSITAGGVTRTWTYAYNAQGLLTQLTGPRTDVAQVWRFTYDTQGHVASTQDPLGHSTQFTAYDLQGHPLAVVDPNGVQLSFTYDVRGRILTRTIAGRTWTYHRDAAGQITGISYPNGATITLTYDGAHRLTDVTDSLGNRQHRTLSVAGDVVRVQRFDASNVVIRQQSYASDGLGRVIATTDANNQTTSIAYDSNGNPTVSTDALGHASRISYDALNRPITLTDAAIEVTAIQFNAYDQPTQVTAPNGAVTQYSYDSFRELVQESSPDRGTSTITYSTAGLPISRLDARGVTASATYDALDRLTLLSFTGASNPGNPTAWLQQLGASILSDNVSFTYDQGTGCTFGFGRLCVRQDQSGAERLSYDAFGNVTQQTHTVLGYSYATQYTYDNANRLTQMTYPDGRVVSYARDALERVSAVQATVNRTATSILSALQYRADGLPSGLTFGNGLAETRSYDPVGRLIGQLMGNSDSRTYAFDAVGNMTSKQTLAESDQFSYDAVNRLSNEQRAQGTSIRSNAFSYDPNGNRLNENRNGSSTALNYQPNSNRLIQIGSSTLALDPAGNTTADTNGTRKFYYSPAGRLQWISQNGIPIAAYLYNALGQRTGKLTLLGITLYHYDVFGRLIGETTAGSQPSRDYVWSGLVPVAQIDHWLPLGNMLQLAHCSVGSDGKIDWVTYLHTDGLTTPRIGTDVARNVVWRWDGEAFGESAPKQAVPAGAYPVYVNLRNPGQYSDQESGLFYNRARYYNPQVGRYISSDSIGLLGGLNTYTYANSSPLINSDPNGECPLCVVVAGGIVGALAQGATTYFVTGEWGEAVSAAGTGFLEGAALTLGAITGAEIVWAGLATTIEDGSVAGALAGEIGALGIEAGIHSIDVGKSISSENGGSREGTPEGTDSAGRTTTGSDGSTANGGSSCP